MTVDILQVIENAAQTDQGLYAKSWDKLGTLTGEYLIPRVPLIDINE